MIAISIVIFVFAVFVWWLDRIQKKEIDRLKCKHETDLMKAEHDAIEGLKWLLKQYDRVHFEGVTIAGSSEINILKGLGFYGCETGILITSVYDKALTITGLKSENNKCGIEMAR